MTQEVTVAIDAMGGDHAPHAVIEGISRSAKSDRDLSFLVFGDEQQITPLLAKFPHLRDRVKVTHTDVVVLPDDKPRDAMRSKRAGSSMRLAVEAVRDGTADYCVSAGNTGALLTVATLVLRHVPGIDRSAIIAPFPTDKKPLAFLDLGANLDVTARYLLQFGIMGAIYSRIIFDIDRPTIGLMNIGTEEGKGRGVLQEARTLLAEANLPGDFVGFVEPHDISHGDTNVVVADGVTGNIAIKMSEGIANFVSRQIRKEIKSDILSMIGGLLARGAFQRARRNIDPRNFNGGMFIGVDGVVMKSHGSSDATAHQNAIFNGAKLARRQITQQIRDALSDFQSHS